MSPAYPYAIDLSADSLRALSGYPPALLTRTSPVIVRRSGQSPQGAGSCFYIGNSSDEVALFVTARHVLRNIEGDPAEAFIFLLQGAVASGGDQEAVPLKVTHICRASEYSDAAILVTAFHESLSNPPELNPKCPQLGEVCLTLGYSDLVLTGSAASPHGESSQFRFELYASQGNVEQVHPRRRDTAMINFPCFRTDSRYKPGMSGGPIMDANGSIIGIVSSASDAGFAYGALIALVAELTVSTSTSLDSAEISVANLIERGAIHSRRSDPPASIRRDDKGVIVHWG